MFLEGALYDLNILRHKRSPWSLEKWAKLDSVWKSSSRKSGTLNSVLSAFPCSSMRKPPNSGEMETLFRILLSVLTYITYKHT